MLKGILVGLDGSAFGETATELGLRWAARFGALVAGHAVIDRPGVATAAVPAGSGYFKLFGDDRESAAAKAKTEALLEAFAARCAAAGVKSRTVLEVGDPAAAILEQAQRYDLLLLGLETHFLVMPGGGACDTLDKVLHSPPRPVVAVPAALGGGAAVVIGYDGSLQASRTLSAYVATGLASGHDNAVVTIDEDFGEASRIAERAADYLALHGVPATARPVETRLDPAAVLLDHAAQLQAGLVVMGAFGHSSLREFFFGSTTRGVLRQCKVPVFLYH